MQSTIDFKYEMLQELEGNILPFWRNRMTDEVNGGFLGRIDGNGVAHPEAEKGAILNARMGKNEEAAKWLNSAIKKDASLADYAEKDLEIINVRR